jgi:hypothetical protein
MTNDVWIEAVKFTDTKFYFVYDYDSDITSDELLVTQSLESAIDHCIKSDLTWELIDNYDD